MPIAVIQSVEVIMAAEKRLPTGPHLDRLTYTRTLSFTAPSKRINDGDDLTFFLSSTAYRDLMTWLLQLNRAVFPRKNESGHIEECKLDSPPTLSTAIQGLRSLLSDLEGLIKDAPPDTGPRRFGNVAFRTWHKLAEQSAGGLIEKYLGAVIQRWAGHDKERIRDLRDELDVYLLGSFGSAQRLDYGTGHELSFLAFLGCLWKLGTFEEGEESAIVLGLIQP